MEVTRSALPHGTSLPRHQQPGGWLLRAGICWVQTALLFLLAAEVLPLARPLFAQQDASSDPKEARREAELELDRQARMGDLYASAGRFADAERIWQKVLLGRQELLGDDHWKVAETRSLIEHVQRRQRLNSQQRERLQHYERRVLKARDLLQEGHCDDAADICEEAAETVREVLGTSDWKYRQALRNSANTSYRARRYAASEKLWRELMQLHAVAYGKESPAYVDDLQQASQVCMERGKYLEAESLLEEDYRIRMAKGGELDIEAACRLTTLVELKLGLHDDYDAAHEMLNQAIAVFEARQVRHGSEYATVLFASGVLAQAEGRFRDAREAYARACDAWDKDRGGDFKAYIVKLDEMADVDMLLGEYRDAQDTLEEKQAMIQTHIPWSRTESLLAADRLITLKTLRGEFTEAEDELTKRQTALLADATTAPPDLRGVQVSLSGIYRLTGRPAQAEAVLRQAWQSFRKERGSGSLVDANYSHQMGTILLAQGKLDKAETLLRAALQVRKEKLPEGHLDIGCSLHQLAILHLKRGQLAEAQDNLKAGLQICESSLGKNNQTYAEMLQTKITLCKAAQDMEGARQAEEQLDKTKAALKQQGARIDELFPAP